MPIMRTNPPEMWVGPIKKEHDWYEVWALVPIKLGDLHRDRSRWSTFDGTTFLNSQDASEYVLKSMRVEKLERLAKEQALNIRQPKPDSVTPPSKEEEPLPPSFIRRKAKAKKEKAIKDMSKEELLDVVSKLSKSVEALIGKG